MEYRAYILKIKKQYVDDYLAAHQPDKLPRQVRDSLAKAGFSQMIVFRISEQEFVLYEQAENLKQTYAKYLKSDEITCSFESRLSKMMEISPEFASDGTLISSESVPVVFYFNNEKTESFRSSRDRFADSRIYRMRLNEKGITEYARLHRNDVVWPGVVETLKKSGLEKMVIFQIRDLVFVFETAQDYVKMHRFIFADEESIRWGKVIAELTAEVPSYNSEVGDLEFKKIPMIFYFEQNNEKA